MRSRVRKARRKEGSAWGVAEQEGGVLTVVNILGAFVQCQALCLKFHKHSLIKSFYLQRRT